MFDKESINRLFAEDKDLMTVSPDGVWVIYKFDRVSNYEIRVESNFETRHRFYLEKNATSKDRLIHHLIEIGLMKDNENF